jgi:ParB-like chromosome segregation protein Spo0J
MENKKYEVSRIQNELDVRLPALHESQVVLFMRLIESGVYLPPVGLYARENKLFIYDGRHRLEAYRRLGKTFIDGLIVDYTSQAEMICLALRANLTAKGTPLAPTINDFSLTVRGLMKEGVSKEEITRQFIKIGIPEPFAKRIVRDAVHSKRKLDELHAVEAVKATRLSILEAAQHYDVPVKILHAKLASEGYGLDRFGLDVQKKFKSLRDLASVRLPELVNGGTTKIGKEAVRILRKDAENFLTWLSAQEVSLR